MIDRRLFTNFDWVFFGLVLLLVGVGIMNIYSASASYRVTGLPFHLKQLSWLAAGLVLMVVVCSIDYHIFEDLSYWFYGAVLFMLILVMLVGRTSMGATRWLDLGFMNIQPSEPMKIVIVMTLARYFSRFPVQDGLGLRDMVYPLLMVTIPALLIMKQPDLGTAVLVLLVSGSVMLFVGIRWRVIVTGLLALVPVVYLGWHHYLRDYQKNRILNFLNPERDPLGSGYHLIQSTIAVGSGGVLGKGYLKGTQTQLRFLPEQHTDFAFSVFAEEWGLVGSLVLLIIYLFLVLWGLQIAGRCNDRFGRLLAVGVTAMLCWHIVINIGMVIGLFPVVGVPLPFLSYGGTSLITSMTGVAILLNVSMRRFMF